MEKDIYEIAENNLLKDMKNILKTNVNINKENEYGCSPLYLAISNRHEEMALLLLEEGADGGLQDSDGFTPLHYAISNNMVNVAKVILEKKPEVLHLENKYGNQPLWVAVMNGEIPSKFITYLLKNGADKNHKNINNFSPFDLAKEYNIKEFTSLFDGY